MPSQQEASKIWAEICQLERQQPSHGEDKQAFFKNKAKEMGRLRAAYDKATGLNSSDPRTAEAIKKRAIDQALLGKDGSGVPTSDNL